MHGAHMIANVAWQSSRRGGCDDCCWGELESEPRRARTRVGAIAMSPTRSREARRPENQKRSCGQRQPDARDSAIGIVPDQRS